jgi:hypothetical protein
MRKLPAALILAALLQSCASPAEHLFKRAAEWGFARRTLWGNGFQLEAFFKAGSGSAAVLHVYLEGDGLPWASLSRVSADPTPRNPLMLGLMRLDPSPSLYLGRPCYNGRAEDAGCSPLLWTYRRYAPEVVESMAQALAGFLRERPHGGLVFIGHSGGGALALLLARRFAATRAAATLAGNTDIDVWADHHGYSRLQGSLNPADVVDGEFPEIHYLAEKDEVIPPALFLPVLQKRRNARIATVPGLDHACCWASPWPSILKNLP